MKLTRSDTHLKARAYHSMDLLHKSGITCKLTPNRRKSWSRAGVFSRQSLGSNPRCTPSSSPYSRQVGSPSALTEPSLTSECEGMFDVTNRHRLRRLVGAGDVSGHETPADETPSSTVVIGETLHILEDLVLLDGHTRTIQSHHGQI